MRYFLSLGSNLGRRRRNLARALQALQKAGVSVVKISSLYQTEPVNGGGPGWFYNVAAEIQTSLDPESLLELTQTIEQKLGRQPHRRQGPRTIDIDILLAEDRVIRSERLTLPHPRLAQRNFVLAPLAEISGETVHPLSGKKIKILRAMSRDPSIVRRLALPLKYANASRKKLGK